LETSESFIYDKDKLTRIDIKYPIYSEFEEIKIEYISHNSANYEAIRNGKTYIGEILFDNLNIINFSLSELNSGFATLYVKLIYQDDELRILKYTNFGNEAEWVLKLDSENRIINYIYQRWE